MRYNKSNKSENHKNILFLAIYQASLIKLELQFYS